MAYPRGGADRSEKALPAAGTVDNSGKRSDNGDLNHNRYPVIEAGQTPDDGMGPTPGGYRRSVLGT